MTLARALQVAAGNSQASADVAEAIDFDGTNDSLSRSTDLVGNTDGNNFTLSFFVYPTTSNLFSVIYAIGTSTGILVNVTGGSTTTSMQVVCRNSTGTLLLNFTVSDKIPLNTFTHILVSCDLSNAANRYVYINDISTSVTWSTYTNGNIDFTGTSWSVGATNLAGNLVAGRLNNVYLDYTYRNLSIEANRRLFVTADLKPAAGQAALNPILYLPMSDPTAPGFNAGTGGNFTLTGTVARSGRGPNQYNAPYSDLDGTADFLSRTSVSGIADGKQFTVQWCGSLDANGNRVISIGASTTERFLITMSDGSGRLQIIGRNSSGTEILNAITPSNTIVLGRNYVVTISIDLGNTSNRYVYINGSAVSMTWTTYSTTNDIDFLVTSSPRYRVGYSAADSNFFNGRLGAVWFNTSYIDLSVAANLAKFVTGTGIDAKPVDLGASGELPTGTAPIIYLPMYGNNAGKNYGTGGDFTVNSGPYTGARGPNEFWSGAGLFNNPTQTELSALTLNNSPDVTGITKTTFAVCFKRRDVDVTDNSVIFNTTSSTNNNFHFTVYFNSSEQLVVGWNGHTVATSSTITDTNWHTLLVSVDSTATVARVYLDNASVSATITLNRTYTQAFTYVGRATGVSADQCFDGNIGFVYQAHDYIDISQEANRLKFFDAFGYPVNLTQQIEDGAIPAAYIYLLFPESNLGTNNGTAGNFTNNSVTASALVKA